MRVAVAPTADGARIDVTDTGVGIDPGELPHIFERFYRGSRANEARGSGSGLGLAIVRSIVDMHGGTVTVESGAEGGSRFTSTCQGTRGSIAGSPAAERADVASAAEGTERIAAAAAAEGAIAPRQADGSADGACERDGNFTVRLVGFEPGVGTLNETTDPATDRSPVGHQRTF